MNPDLSKYEITGNAVVDGLILKAIVAAATTTAGILAAKLGITDGKFPAEAVEMLVPIAVAGAALVWGTLIAKFGRAKAVQAGINLAVTGRALAADGQTVIRSNDGTTPPKPVTVETAKMIVKTFG